MPHTKSYDLKNYVENDWLLEEVTKRRNIVLLKVGILRQRQPKMDPVWENYNFYKIIMIIKIYAQKRKLELAKTTNRKVVVDGI